jgi:putative component of membrane protein insertase Oxa1/YidC/SpoIIIJ protein YidD
MMKQMQRMIFPIVLMVLSAISNAQSSHSVDIDLIGNKKLLSETDLSYYKRPGNNTNVMQSRDQSMVAHFNPVYFAFKTAMLLYQNILSPQLSKSCPYEITCSNFAKQAIEKFGLIKGIFIGADRLLRCNRIALLDLNMLDIDKETGGIIDPLTNY